MTKELYPDIAKITGTTSSGVERSIRYARKKAIAQDTGNYTGNHIDILCESEAAAQRLGTYKTKVYIKSEGGKECGKD
ncbi:hypothetical protein HMPREF0982_02969 [Erysipelotrichaceae bacterium 21_3]|nr:hypothetical protein HMPREF0982_02969 [Erysipelotrichaceae bacterium 21_3]